MQTSEPKRAARLERSSDRLRATLLPEVVQAEARPLPGMHRSGALEVRQLAVGLSVPPVGRAQQSEERLILVDWHELAVTLCPSLGYYSVAKSKYPDFGHEWCAHRFFSLKLGLVERFSKLDPSRKWKNALRCY